MGRTGTGAPWSKGCVDAGGLCARPTASPADQCRICISGARAPCALRPAAWPRAGLQVGPTRELLGSYVLQLLAPQSLLPGDMAPSPLDRQSPGAEASSPTSRPQGAVTARGVTEYAFGSGLYPFWSGPLISHKIPCVNRVPWVGGRCAGPCGPTYRPWCSQTQLSEKEPALHLHTCLVSCLPLSQSSAPHLTPPIVLQRSYLSVSCLSVKRDYLGTLQNKRKQTTLFKSF